MFVWIVSIFIGHVAGCGSISSMNQDNTFTGEISNFLIPAQFATGTQTSSIDLADSSGAVLSQIEDLILASMSKALRKSVANSWLPAPTTDEFLSATTLEIQYTPVHCDITSIFVIGATTTVPTTTAGTWCKTTCVFNQNSFLQDIGSTCATVSKIDEKYKTIVANAVIDRSFTMKYPNLFNEEGSRKLQNSFKEILKNSKKYGAAFKNANISLKRD